MLGFCYAKKCNCWNCKNTVRHIINVFSFVMCPIFFAFKWDFWNKKDLPRLPAYDRVSWGFRDIAHWLNNVDRPKPNVGYTLENDSSLSSQLPKNVWGKPYPNSHTRKCDKCLIAGQVNDFQRAHYEPNRLLPNKLEIGNCSFGRKNDSYFTKSTFTKLENIK